MSQLIQEVWVKPLELDGAVLIFWSEGGFQGVPGCAGSCRELPGPIPVLEDIDFLHERKAPFEPILSVSQPRPPGRRGPGGGPLPPGGGPQPLLSDKWLASQGRFFPPKTRPPAKKARPPAKSPCCSLAALPAGALFRPKWHVSEKRHVS